MTVTTLEERERRGKKNMREGNQLENRSWWKIGERRGDFEDRQGGGKEKEGSRHFFSSSFIFFGPSSFVVICPSSFS